MCVRFLINCLVNASLLMTSVLTKNTSKYYDFQTFNQLNLNSGTTFGFFHLNIASLPKHHEELDVLLTLLKYQFKVIAISETRIANSTEEITHLELNDFDTKTLTSTGGTRLHINNSLKNDVKVRHDLCMNLENGFETVFVEITQKNRKNIVCGCIYKHPTLSPASFAEECLVKILPQITREDKLVTIMGDFNINLMTVTFDLQIFTI